MTRMISAKDIILGQLKCGQYLIETFTADLTDAEYYKPPVAGGNQRGVDPWPPRLHRGLGRVGLQRKVRNHISQVTRAIFKPGNPCLPDASKYPTRKEMDELFKNSRANLVEKLMMAEN